MPAFDRAASAGVPFTVHAGEAGGPDSVREVLDTLAPARIGHGVRSIEDPSPVDRLVEAGVHLEVCPTCNVQLGVFADLSSHPVGALFRSGVRLSISTDSRTSTVTTLREEYAALTKTFGWQAPDVAAVNRMAIDAAFASDAVKARVRDLIHQAAGAG